MDNTLGLNQGALVPDDNLGILEREAHTVAELCDATGCTLVVAPDAKWVRKRSADRLKRVSDILGPGGIRVGVEPIAFPHFTVWDLEESMEIIQASGVTNAALVAAVDGGFRGAVSVEIFNKEVWDMELDRAARLCATKIGDFAGKLAGIVRS